MRAVQGQVYGLDFPAVLQVAALTGVDVHLVADILPAVETYIVIAWNPEREE